MLAHAQEAPEPEELYRIGDVSRLTDTKPFVLRYWETEFPMLQPVKTPKGHRLYRREDIELIRAIKRLLYEEGFTIAGARRHLSEVLANGHDSALAARREGTEIQPDGPGPELVIPSRAAAAQSAPQFAESAQAESSRAVVGPEVGHTLRAVREELLAILTLLGTR
jgi:DNA-binding transcriptional MerR regulator